ncbi:MAG TPA: MlaA family lipoprotein [Methylomirabilota bacterium]|nr:MlaA family lipoprotein [Methylomirabilota bacterium]
MLLPTVLVVALSGCGTFSGLLKSDDSPTAGAPVVQTAAADPQPASAPAPDERPAEPAAPSSVSPDVAPAGTTLAAVPPLEVLPLQARADDEEGSALAQRATDAADQMEEDYDPWESFNEKMFSFNRNLDKYVLKPAARGYRFVMPEPWQVLISNGFSNINFVPRLVNSLLQAKWGGAGRELSRFLINSTAGVGGLFDPAKDYWGIEKSREDFGQTLGVWGAPAGPYLVLPLMEPLTVRDGIGKAVDGAMDPLSYVLPFFWDRLGMKAGDTLNDRALNYDLFQGFEESVIDMYSAVRHGYLQRRQQLIKE